MYSHGTRTGFDPYFFVHFRCSVCGRRLYKTKLAYKLFGVLTGFVWTQIDLVLFGFGVIFRQDSSPLQKTSRVPVRVPPGGVGDEQGED